MSDETVPVGEQVRTSGGDGIFPKGLPIGTVTKVSTGSDLFLNVRVRPSADLSRLEEVLVVTKVDERQAQPDSTTTGRAVDILAERLPSVPPKPTTPADGANKSSAAPPIPVAKPGTTGAASTGKPATTASGAGTTKPSVNAGTSNATASKVGTSSPAAPTVKKKPVPASPSGALPESQSSPATAPKEPTPKPSSPNNAPGNASKPDTPPQGTPQ
jgi:rod shape-determining protein MreC